MKTKQLTLTGGKFLLTGLAALAISLGSAFAAQQDDQVAIQLGAIQLGISQGSLSSNATLAAQALVQGRAVLKATIKSKTVVQASGGNFTANQTQTTNFQQQIFTATQRALNSPVTIPISKVSVMQTSGKPVIVTATLDPKKTTASAVLAYTLKRLPNFGPALVQNSVAAAFAGGGTPVYGYKGTPEKLQAAQLTDAGKAATNALSASLKAYVAGTQNWAPVPKTGPVVGVNYLPNYSTKSMPASGSNVFPANTAGISKAASAISANAINGLGNTVSGLYGKTAGNVMTLTTALVKGALAFQKTSTTGVTVGVSTTVGAIGASTLGIVSQVAGDQNANWAGAASAVLNGVVSGAVKASKANAWIIAVGVAQGFAGTYLKSVANASGTPITASLFKTANTAAILAAFIAAKATTNTGTNSSTSITNFIDQAIDATYTAFATDNVGSLTGAAGIKNFGLINGVGTPVTDTVGM